MRSPAFPPRRPSSFIRVAIPAFLLVFLFYYLHADSSFVPESYVHNQAPRPPHEVPDRIPDQDAPSHLLGPEKSHGHSPGIPELIHDEAKPATSTTSLVELPSASATQPVTPSAAGSPVDPSVSSTPSADTDTGSPPKLPAAKKRPHPIDDLMAVAEQEFAALVAKETKTLNDAAAAYRKRRGRHPPPGFAAWHEFAVERNATIVEHFFDQIYHDLSPFWGLSPGLIRREAHRYEMTINVRNGKASAQSDWFWTKIWLNMTQTIEHLLPDMDLALNAMDEPRIVAHWEQIRQYMKTERTTRSMPPPKDVLGVFKGLPSADRFDNSSGVVDKAWEGTKPFWDIARRGCPPQSDARVAEIMVDYNNTPIITGQNARPHLYKGFVSNWTLSRSFCHQADLQGLEGIFIEPLSTSSTKVLFPLFGGSKLETNNEILLPAPMYWNEEERFTGGPDRGGSWAEKSSKVIWRGVATGGRNRETNWKGFQRHRFVSMNNGTKIARAEEVIEAPINFALPTDEYGLESQRAGNLSGWVDSFADVAFTDLSCTPVMEKGQCNYTGPYFKQKDGLKMAKMFDHKFLPDIDGNSFSGRYLGFLRSTSLPIKATLWKEWHDSRLVAWKHFVPMDNRFGDWYAIMEYFLGYGEMVAAHDEEAERIATEGKEWADRVLRKEDMQIYTLRLLLEYARVFADDRDRLGWVDDLLSGEAD